MMKKDKNTSMGMSKGGMSKKSGYMSGGMTKKMGYAKGGMTSCGASNPAARPVKKAK
jgi:hypothetical protein